jgi:hypothetical protein
LLTSLDLLADRHHGSVPILIASARVSQSCGPLRAFQAFPSAPRPTAAGCSRPLPPRASPVRPASPAPSRHRTCPQRSRATRATSAARRAAGATRTRSSASSRAGGPRP